MVGIESLSDALGHVTKAYLIGHSARDFALQLGDVPYEICETMDNAVAAAAKDARSGDTVLLAPAAASFDQYPDFEKRGRGFHPSGSGPSSGYVSGTGIPRYAKTLKNPLFLRGLQCVTSLLRLYAKETRA